MPTAVCAGSVQIEPEMSPGGNRSFFLLLFEGSAAFREPLSRPLIFLFFTGVFGIRICFRELPRVRFELATKDKDVALVPWLVCKVDHPKSPKPCQQQLRNHPEITLVPLQQPWYGFCTTRTTHQHSHSQPKKTTKPLLNQPLPTSTSLSLISPTQLYNNHTPNLRKPLVPYLLQPLPISIPTHFNFYPPHLLLISCYHY